MHCHPEIRTWWRIHDSNGWSLGVRIKVKGQPTADNSWLYNDSAQVQLPCGSVGITLHYVYARRNQWMYRWSNVHVLCKVLESLDCCCPIASYLIWYMYIEHTIVVLFVNNNSNMYLLWTSWICRHRCWAKSSTALTIPAPSGHPRRVTLP